MSHTTLITWIKIINIEQLFYMYSIIVHNYPLVFWKISI